MKRGKILKMVEFVIQDEAFFFFLISSMKFLPLSVRWMTSSAAWRRKRRRAGAFGCASERRSETWRGRAASLPTMRRPSLYDITRHDAADAVTHLPLTDVTVCVCQSLEVLLRGKSLELEQVRDACRNIQQHQQESQERHDRAIREQDAIINQLQAELRAGMQEAQVHTGSDLNKTEVHTHET